MTEKEVIERVEKYIKSFNGNALDCIAIGTVLTLLEKKNKQIDELEDIFYNYQLCEYELTDCTYRKCEYIADDENPPCKECIKQYFERKVENGN